MIKLWHLDGSLGPVPENAIVLKGEDWIKDIARVKKTTIRRSLDGTLYSFISRDRDKTDQYEYTISFKTLDKEKTTELKTFINEAEGRICGWQDSLGGIHAVLVLPEQVSIRSEKRAAGSKDGTTQEDEWHSTTLKLQIIKSLGGQLS